MQIPIAITFRDMTSSPALVESIGDWARKLEEVHALQRCSVIVEQATKHGSPFVIHLDFTIPGHEFAVTHGDKEQKDPYVAVADAFRTAKRQLTSFINQRREARTAG